MLKTYKRHRLSLYFRLDRLYRISRRRPDLVLALLILGFAVGVQAQTVTVSSSLLMDGPGSNPANGTITWSPVLSNGQAASYRSGGGGQHTVTPASVKVINGAFTLTLPDTLSTNPKNLCFSVLLTGTKNPLGAGYSCVQPAFNNSWCVNGQCNFDNYIPALVPLLPTVQGPPGPPGGVPSVNGAPNAFVLSGAGVSCNTTSNTTTCIVSGSSGTAISPLTTKGQIWGYGASDMAVPGCPDTQVHVADSTQPSGWKCGAAATGPKGDTGATGATGATGTAGTNGNTIWSGTSAPSSGTGVNGDFFLLNPATAPCLYGPKASGAWPGSCVTLVGPQGTSGSGSGNVSGSGTTTVGHFAAWNNTSATAINDTAYGPSSFDAAGAAATAQGASLQKSSNLSDLANAGTARSNLGLGTAATQASTAFDAAGAASTAQTNAIAAIPGASSTAPIMNGTAAVGAGTTYARADHVHPSDTSRVPTTTTVNGHALSANVVVSASDLTTGTLPHTQLPALVSGDIPSNAASTSGNAATATNINGNGTANQVWGMNAGGTAQGWQTPSGGSMTWPSGVAGSIPNYNGSGWGTSYNASNVIPANFLASIPESQVTNLTSDLAGKAASNASTTVNGQPCALGSSCTISTGGGSGTFGQSTATNAAIAATTLVASVPSTPGMYEIDWEVSLTAVGVACTGSTVVTLNHIFTDPATSAAITNPVGTITIANGVGALGYVASGVETILAKNATALQYSTAYTAGAGCTTNPTYQVSYVFTQIR